MAYDGGRGYHLNLTAPQVTITTTFTGNYSSTDTVGTVAQSRVKSGGLNGSSGAKSSVLAAGNIAKTVNAAETAVLCDPFFGDPLGDPCTFQGDSDLFIDTGGGIHARCDFYPWNTYPDCQTDGSVNLPALFALSLPFVWVNTTTTWTTASGSCSSTDIYCGLGKGCDYENLTPYCANGAQNPDASDLPFPTVRAEICGSTTSPTGLWGFETFVPCMYWKHSDGSKTLMFCDTRFGGQPESATPLKNPPDPQAEGPCTFNGITN